MLRESFIEYLRVGAPASSSGIAATLLEAGYPFEGSLIESSGWCKGVEPWRDRRVFVGRQPPGDAALGELWLDTVEVMPMVLVEEPARGTAHPPKQVWLAVRPVMRWQFAGFIAVARIVARPVEVAPHGLRSLDPTRIESGPELAPITSVTHGEARLYANWFGKTLGGRNRWEAAARALGDRFDALWWPGLREWSIHQAVEELRTRDGVDDWQLDDDDAELDEARDDIHVDEHHYDIDTGFRTAIKPPLLSSTITLDSFEPIALDDLFAR